MLEEINDSGGVLARYTTENDSYYGPWLHLQRYTGESRFPLYDEIGSARGLVDASGTVTNTYDMDTFGRPLASTGTTPNPYRYGAAWGYITDPSGLLQLGARYYWPEVGRFVSQDPEGDGVNWYAYAASNPVVWDDPDGFAAGQSLRGRGRALGGGRGGAGLGAPGGGSSGGGRGGGRPCPKPKPKPKAKRKPSPRSGACKQCDLQYLQGFQAIRDGIANPGAIGARGAAMYGAAKATEHASCAAGVGAATAGLQMTNVLAAVSVNQKVYQDCCSKHHCEVLGASQLARGGGQ